MIFFKRKQSPLSLMRTLKQLLKFLSPALLRSCSLFMLAQRCLTLSFSSCKNNKVKLPAHRKFKFDRPTGNQKLSVQKKMLQKVLKSPDTEFLHGRSVCEIVMTSSQRPVFRLNLSNRWEIHPPSDERIVKIVSCAQGRGIPIEYVDNWTLEEIAGVRSHQGVCLEVGQLTLPVLDDAKTQALINQSLSERNVPLWVLLMNVGDPGNVGAILRTCYFLGIDKLFLTKQCAPLSSTTSKASSGAAEVIKCYTVKHHSDFLKLLCEAGWDIIGTDVSEDVHEPIDTLSSQEVGTDRTAHRVNLVDVQNVQLEKPSLVLLGSEGDGIPVNVEKFFTKSVTIKPGQGGAPRCLVPCLNVSTAAGIVLHHLMHSVK